MENITTPSATMDPARAAHDAGLLFSQGLRSTDRTILRLQYGYTDAETDALCACLAHLERQPVPVPVPVPGLLPYADDMLPVVFINSRSVPYVDLIMRGEKRYETRSRRTLHALVGRRILIAETGRRKLSLVRCSAILAAEVPVRSREDWERLRPFHCVPAGDAFDWKPDARVRWLYTLEDVQPIRNPFRCPEGVRHGRTWLEYRPDKP